MKSQGLNSFDLMGKVAVVIGGTSGIGLAIARALRKGRATVVPSSRREDAVRRTVKQLEPLEERRLV